MKKLSILLIAVASVFLFVGSVFAAPYTWTDIFNPTPDVKIDHKKTYSYTHSLSGFVPLKDLITDYKLTIALYDDCDRERKYAYVDLPGLVSDDFYNFKLEYQDFGVSILGLLSLNLYGTYDVNIRSLWGDFYFDYSELVAKGYKAVPEPATMLLLGLGLVGLAGFGRKKFNS